MNYQWLRSSNCWKNVSTEIIFDLWDTNHFKSCFIYLFAVHHHSSRSPDAGLFTEMLKCIRDSQNNCRIFLLPCLTFPAGGDFFLGSSLVSLLDDVFQHNGCWNRQRKWSEQSDQRIEWTFLQSSKLCKIKQSTSQYLIRLSPIYVLVWSVERDVLSHAWWCPIHCITGALYLVALAVQLPGYPTCLWWRISSTKL